MIFLSGLIYLLFLAALALFSGRPRSDMSGFIVFPALSLALFILWSIIFCRISTPLPRGLQYSAAILSSLALAIVIGLAAVVRNEPAGQTPWAIRPFIPWAPWILPLAAIAIATIWTNKDLGVDPAIPRAAFAILSALVILANLGLLGEAIYWNQQRAVQKIAAIEQRETERDRTILEQTNAADPEKDFGSLLSQTSRFENPKIREIALKKVLSAPNFTGLMTEQLHHYYYFASALTFLRDDDAPDKAALAEPIRDAFLLVAKNVQESMREVYNPRNSQFVSDADTVLTVADKFAQYGVDYAPAIREYRNALDEPGKSPRYEEEKLKTDLDSRRQLDRWLAVHKPAK
jgi:hypothetical protein